MHNGQIWTMRLPQRLGGNAESRFLIAQRLFHMAGLFAPKGAVLLHGKLAILPGFEPRQYIETASRYRVTSIGGVPTLLARIIKEVDLLQTLDLSSIKTIVLGSAPLTAALHQKIQAAFPHAYLAHGYGSTEAGGGVFDNPPPGVETPAVGDGAYSQRQSHRNHARRRRTFEPLRAVR